MSRSKRWWLFAIAAVTSLLMVGMGVAVIRHGSGDEVSVFSGAFVLMLGAFNARHALTLLRDLL